MISLTSKSNYQKILYIILVKIIKILYIILTILLYNYCGFFLVIEIGFGIVLFTWAYFGFFVDFGIKPGDILLYNPSNFETDESNFVDPNFLGVILYAPPVLLRLSDKVSSFSITCNLEDTDVPEKVVNDLRILVGPFLVIVDVRLKLRRLFEYDCCGCLDACYKKWFNYI